MVYNCFDKKTKGSGIAANNEIKENIQLADELHKPTNRKFYKKSVFFISRQYLGCRFGRYEVIE